MLRKKKNQMPLHSTKSYHPVINYNRVLDRKRVVWPKASEENEFISLQVKKLLAKEIGTDEFKSELTKKEIKIDADPIKRQIRLVEQGKDIQYKDFMACITRYKNQNNRIESFEKKVETIKPIKAHKPSESDGQNLNSHKKFIYVPTYESQKEIYDWEKTQYENASNYEQNSSAITSVKPSSQVFNGEINNKENKNINRKNPNQNKEGEIIKWKKEKSPKTVKTVEVSLADKCSKRNTNTTTPSEKKNKSIFGYKNDSIISFNGEKQNGEPSKDLNRQTSTKNLKLHMSSTDNFLQSLKTSSE